MNRLIEFCIKYILCNALLLVVYRIEVTGFTREQQH